MTERNATKTELKQTGIEVPLVGADGNAFAIIGLVRRALRQAGYGEDFVKAFMDEATGGDYNHLLKTVMDVVEVS